VWKEKVCREGEKMNRKEGEGRKREER